VTLTRNDDDLPDALLRPPVNVCSPGSHYRPEEPTAGDPRLRRIP
jgi:hypothetical protein